MRLPPTRKHNAMPKAFLGVAPRRVSGQSILRCPVLLHLKHFLFLLPAGFVSGWAAQNSVAECPAVPQCRHRAAACIVCRYHWVRVRVRVRVVQIYN